MAIPYTWVNITVWIVPQPSGEDGAIATCRKRKMNGGRRLSALGLRVARFRNDGVVRDVSTVVGRIKGLV